MSLVLIKLFRNHYWIYIILSSQYALLCQKPRITWRTSVAIGSVFLFIYLPPESFLLLRRVLFFSPSLQNTCFCCIPWKKGFSFYAKRVKVLLSKTVCLRICRLTNKTGFVWFYIQEQIDNFFFVLQHFVVMLIITNLFLNKNFVLFY